MTDTAREMACNVEGCEAPAYLADGFRDFLLVPRGGGQAAAEHPMHIRAVFCDEHSQGFDDDTLGISGITPRG